MKSNTAKIPTRPKRQFVDEDLIFDSWQKIEVYFRSLLDRKINSVADLEQWMLDRSELESVMQEEIAWRSIKRSINTKDQKLLKDYTFWIQEISPKADPFSHKLDLKLISSQFLKELDNEKYHIYLRDLQKSIELYRDENIPLFVELNTKKEEYSAITAKRTVEIDGQKMTMQKAAQYFKDTNRDKREEVFNIISTKNLQDVIVLDQLFDELISLRQQIAKNAGFENYRDYKFVSLGRFDYTTEDCYSFHESIAKEIVPITDGFHKDRMQKMGLDDYKPWDTSVDSSGKAPLKPFEGGKDLINKSIRCFERLRPYYGECLRTMKAMNHIDLESKDGKAPGGFNAALLEIGVPFIFMNAVGSQRDLVTMVHEGGHAIHSFLCRDLPLADFKSVPSEVAELASMTMELISMDTWDEFYNNQEELNRAKKEQLQSVLDKLPWIAAIDRFQHWIYTTPHTADERRAEWENIMSDLSCSLINWDGYEKVSKNQWQLQLHLFRVPFYYIEYGMAQLGAIAMWRSYKQLGSKALDNFDAALKLGYTKSIGEIYQTAGIEFNFSQEYVKELADFIKTELASMN